MDPKLVRTVAETLGVSSERVFGRAFEYAERGVAKKYVLYQFLEWHYKGTVHSDVEDYCLDVLAGRTKAKVKKTRNLKKVGSKAS